MMSSRSSFDGHYRKRSLHDVTVLSSIEDDSSMRRTRRPRKSYDSDAYTSPSESASTRRVRKSRVASIVSTDEESTRLTKTGRVSRALKGQPVHKCDVCSKFYTRAEHLRRHQLNHKSQPTWLCDVPGCEKSEPAKGFYREDLLQRHKEDHLNTISAGMDSPQFTNVTIPQAQQSNARSETIIASSFTDPFGSSYGMMVPQLNNLSMSTPHLSLSSMGSEGHMPAPSSYSYSEPAPLNQRDSFWQAPPSSFNASRSLSPASISLSLSPFSVPWSEFEPQSIFDMSSAGSDYTAATSTSVSSPELRGMSLFDCAVNSELSLIDQDLQESAIIENEVAGLSVLAEDSIGLSTFWSLECRYMPLFWSKFAISFPIIHEASFRAMSHVPMLLRALMVAAGAASGRDMDSRLITRSLLQTCLQLLDARESLTSSSRVTDLQMTFIAEALGLYRSGKPVHGLSPRFEAMSAMLQFDPAMGPSQINELLLYTTSAEALSSVHQIWIEQESKRRLQMACYVLETQQAALFECQRDLTYGDIPFPCSSALWAAQDIVQWQELFRQEGTYTKRLYDVLDPLESDSYDDLTCAAIISFTTGGHKYTVAPPSAVLHSITRQPAGEFCYHAMQLASHTPFSDILSIAGDSFVLGKRSPSQLEQAQQNVQLWTRSESVSKAMFHAVHLLRTVFTRRRTGGVLHEDWALYLAGLVCYTTGMWLQKEVSWLGEEEEPMSISTGQRMKAFLARFDTSLASVNDGQDQSLHISDFEGTRACLNWTRKRISGSVGGLMENALTTLERLVGQPMMP